MNRKKNTEAAKDLWSQVFARQAAHPSAAIWDPEYDRAADEAVMREAFRQAGWRDEEVEQLIDLQRQREAAAPVTSPGVNPFVEFLHARLCDDVEGAMNRLKIESHATVARGVEPRVGPFAAKIGVIMTDESVITVGSFLFRFCGLVARAFTRTLQLNPWLWDREDYAPDLAMSLLRQEPELIRYWMNIYFAFAMSGTHMGVPYRPSTKTEVILMEQVARAMEIFAIAHEYGHHHLAHGRNIAADARQEEFDADQFALKICYWVDLMPVTIKNPYLISGAGGVVMLMALDTLRLTCQIFGEPGVDVSTHPSVKERLERFDTVRMLFPDEFRWLKAFRTASGRIMSVVQDILLPGLAQIPSHDLNEIRKLRHQMRATFDANIAFAP
jgi:hypothetical protein